MKKLKKWGSKMDLILPDHGTYVNYGTFFFSSARDEQKPLSFFKICFHLPIIHLGIQLVKLAKKSGFYFLGG
jgi:hypothetical protein